MIIKNSQLNQISDENKNLKKQLTNLNLRNVEITNENKNLKDDIETLRDETRNLSITLKRVKSDFKDTTKKNNVEKNAIEKNLGNSKKLRNTSKL